MVIDLQTVNIKALDIISFPEVIEFQLNIVKGAVSDFSRFANFHYNNPIPSTTHPIVPANQYL